MSQIFFHKRIIFDVILFVLLFVSPYWLTGAFAFLGLITIPFYVEFIMVFFCIESLYRGSIPLFANIVTTTPAWSSTLFWATLVFVSAEFLRTLIRKHTRTQ